MTSHRVPILTGREFERGVEVKSGLDAGETVIVAPPVGLTDGQRLAAKTST